MSFEKLSKETQSESDLEEILLAYPDISISRYRLGENYAIFQRFGNNERVFYLFFQHDLSTNEINPCITHHIQESHTDLFIELTPEGLTYSGECTEEYLEECFISIKEGLEIMNVYDNIPVEEKVLFGSRFSGRVKDFTQAGDSTALNLGINQPYERISQIFEQD